MAIPKKIIVIAIIVSLLNISHIFWQMRMTPKNYVYLATGHYYKDYFVYLEPIAQGVKGDWVPRNYLTTDDNSINIRSFPYIILGHLGGLVRLSPITIYWSSVFIFTIIFIYLIYVAIKYILPKSSDYIKILSLLFAISISPFYKLQTLGNQISLIPYDFWYGPSNFIRRFGTVSYHLLGNILSLLIILISALFINKINEKKTNSTLFSILISNILVILLLSFSPISAAGLTITLILTFSYFLWKSRYQWQIFKWLLIYISVILINILIAGILIKLSYGSTDLIKRISTAELQWREKPTILFILQNLGPSVLFFPFGLLALFKSLNPFKIILALFVAISYILFFSPLAVYLGTHNLRFLSSISYILYGLLTVLGIKQLVKLLHLPEKPTVIIIGLILLIYSWLFNGYVLYQRAIGADVYTPITHLTYLPKSVIDGLEFLKKLPDKAVLTGPVSGVGMLIPIHSYKHTFIGRDVETPDYEKKQSVADNFFKGEMDKKYVRELFSKNNIGYVVLTYMDAYNPQQINNYDFLHLIYNDPLIKIWQVIL